MKYSTLFRFVIMFAFVCLIKAAAAAQEVGSNDQIEVLLKQMKAADWETRSSAFYKLLDLSFGGKSNGQTWQIPEVLAKFSRNHPNNADEINTTLIGLLEMENNLVREQDKKFELTGETLTEEYTNYYGDLIATVAGLKDSRSVTALVGAMNTGNMATKALAELAPFSIDIVAKKVGSDDSLTRDAATIVLSQMLETANINRLETAIPGSREKIKNLLIKKAKDADYNVRLSAINGLAKLQDVDAVKVLEEVSQNDPYQSVKGGTVSYPLREAAKGHLGRMKRN
ncbi:MAG: HEAT repeat domain-containing protein [Blastocatellia bacterium]|nr:HEAT repeat domain-containing protein [Blastocatellia bacterium]